MNEDNKRLRVVISGRVQGVFYRASAKNVAEGNALVGYAKNLSDGRVEIVAEGSEGGLRKLLDWGYRGSLLAHVESLSFHWEEPTGEFDKFSVELDEGSFIRDKASALKNLTKRVVGRFKGNAPRHLVIIPDGNRRWASERGLSAWQGHKSGVKQIKRLIKEGRELGVKYMTFWGFSTENWKRDKMEVGFLMKTLSVAIDDFGEEALKNEVRFHHFGRRDRLPAEIVNKIVKLEEETRHFTEHHLGLALDYGGRDDMLRAINTLKKEDCDICEESVSGALDTRNFPDADFIIRTSGEQRTSGMMPWQATYAEYYFSPLHFPDFSPAELRLAVEDFSSRNRRIGK